MEDTTGAKPATIPTALELLAQLGITRAPAEKVANASAELRATAHEPSPGEVLTIIVDASGGGAFTSLQAAIRSAQPGVRIQVRPGRYHEGIVLTKDVQIFGDGPAREIILETPDSHCLVMQTGHALVHGLTLRSYGACKGNQRFAVEIAQGRLILEDCDISSDTLAGVSIHGRAADPLIERCHIHDGASSGVVVWDHGRGTVRDCDILGNALTGVLLRTGGDPAVQGCRIRSGKTCGILVEEGGRGIVEDCELADNAVAGVQFVSGGNAILRRCHIQGGEAVGILALLDGQGSVEDCVIGGNRAGVLLLEGRNPVFRRCQICDGKAVGVAATRHGRGVFEECDLFGFGRAEVEIT
jgi:hypothetical protein